MFNLWKSSYQYNMKVSNFVKNTYEDGFCESNKFKARPLKVYRRRYTDKIGVRNNNHLCRILDTPGSYVVQDLNSGDDNGLKLDYMLSKKDNSKKNCESLKCYRTSKKGNIVYSNKELLYKRQKTFLQNMAKIKTERRNNYEFKVGDKVCSESDEYETMADVMGYNKLKNEKHLSNSGVSGGERILRRKYETIRRDAKLNNLSTNSIGMSMAYNIPLKSKIYDKFDKSCVRNKMIKMGNKLVNTRCWIN